MDEEEALSSWAHQQELEQEQFETECLADQGRPNTESKEDECV